MVTVVVVEVATVEVLVTVERVARQEHAELVAAGDFALRHAGAAVARLTLLLDGRVQVETWEVAVWVPATKVEVVVLGKRCQLRAENEWMVLELSLTQRRRKRLSLLSLR